MLINFNHAQAILIVLIDDGLDAGGLSGSAVSVQKSIVGVASLNKGLCVFPQHILLHLIADEIIKNHAVHIVDGKKFHIPVFTGADAKRLV